MRLSTAPEPLGERHDIAQFNSGVSSIDTWLRSKAHLNEAGGGARAVVVQAVDERAKSFYERFGFRPFSDREAFMLAVRMSEVRALLAA